MIVRRIVSVPTPEFVREVAIGARVTGRYQRGELLFTSPHLERAC